MPMPGWSNGGRGNLVADGITSARNKAQIAEREATNAKVFEAAQAQFGDLGSSRLLMNSEGGYYLPQSANPRRGAAEGDTNWGDAYIGDGPGIADTAALKDAQGILGFSSGLAEADSYDQQMSRARGALKMKPDVSRQDRMQDQHAQGYSAFDRAIRSLR